MEMDGWSDSDGEMSDPESCFDDSKDEDLICLTDSIPKLQFRKDALKARWDDDMGMAEIVERKGRLLNTMGIVRNGKIFCSIEETLFLAEIGALKLMNNEEIPISLDAIYDKVAGPQSGCNWEAFQVYRNLKSLGYIVGRHNIPWSLKNVKSNHVSAEDFIENDESSESACAEVTCIDSLLNNMQIKEAKPVFDVYLPNSQFKKSSPGDPTFVICSTGSNPSSEEELERLERQCNDIPLRFNIVDHGRVSFYSFNKVELPVLP